MTRHSVNNNTCMGPVISLFKFKSFDQLNPPNRPNCLKGPVKLIKRVKIAHSFLRYVSNQFDVIILSLPM